MTNGASIKNGGADSFGGRVLETTSKFQGYACGESGIETTNTTVSAVDGNYEDTPVRSVPFPFPKSLVKRR